MITKACLRDITYIAANLRERDKRELNAQIGLDMTPSQAAVICYEASCEDTRYIAYDRNGEPAMAFGFGRTISPTLWHGWGFGTNAMRRVVPEATEFVMLDLLPQFMSKYRPKRLEARALADNDLSHRWLTKLGATVETPLIRYGVGGETFLLYAWVDTTIWTSRELWCKRHSMRTSRDPADVLHGKASQAAETPADPAAAYGA